MRIPTATTESIEAKKDAMTGGVGAIGDSIVDYNRDEDSQKAVVICIVFPKDFFSPNVEDASDFLHRVRLQLLRSSRV